MGDKIYYFTGSGNSLAMAKAIASHLGDTEVLPMSKHLDSASVTGTERIGMICPVYAWGPPRMVKDFVTALKPTDGQYFYAITSCGGTPGKSAAFIDKWLHASGGKLSAGFIVRGDFLAELPGMNEIPIIRFARWLGRNHVPQYAKDRLPKIVEIIENKRRHPVERSNLSVNLVTAPMYGAASKSFKGADKAFAASDKCVSCGTCVRVCPRENVVLADGRPTWHQDCESCYACFLWCPQKAITLNGYAPNEPSHHPDVTLEEMMLR